MIFAAIDIGNTNIKTGIFVDGEFKEFRFFPDFELAKKYILSFDKIDNCAVSSVVPNLTREFSDLFLMVYKFTPYIITINSRFNFDIDYETPGTLGIDRICSCEGALYLSERKGKKEDCNSFIVTSDLGTATTINILQSGKGFIGGIITPGLFTMANSLFKNTAQLPQIEFGDYKELIGKNTSKAIESGIINSTLGLYYMAFNHIKKELLADETDFYITGGNAKHIMPFIKHKFTYVEELIIYGIKTIFELNNYDNEKSIL